MDNFLTSSNIANLGDTSTVGHVRLNDGSSRASSVVEKTMDRSVLFEFTVNIVGFIVDHNIILITITANITFCIRSSKTNHC